MGKFVLKIAFWKEMLVVVTELDTYKFVRFADPFRFDAFRFERPDPFPKKMPP
jgi:hypothetical protein